MQNIPVCPRYFWSIFEEKIVICYQSFHCSKSRLTSSGMLFAVNYSLCNVTMVTAVLLILTSLLLFSVVIMLTLQIVFYLFLIKSFATWVRIKVHENINIDAACSMALALTLMFLCIRAAWHSYKAPDLLYLAAFDFPAGVTS